MITNDYDISQYFLMPSNDTETEEQQQDSNPPPLINYVSSLADVKEGANNVIEAFRPIFESKSLINIIYGGRSGGKSTTMGKLAFQKMCESRNSDFIIFREFSKSIKESSTEYIVAAFESAGKLDELTINRSVQPALLDIRGNRVYTAGLSAKTKTDKGIKSFFTNKTKFVWFDECESMSDESFAYLKNTLKGGGYQLYFTFNPLNADNVLMRLAAREQGLTTTSIKVNYTDNPFLTEDDERQRLLDKDIFPEPMYRWIWEGEPRGADGSIITPQDIQTLRHNYKLTQTSSININQFMDLPAVMGVDVGRSGDLSAITIRRGRYIFHHSTYSNQNGESLASNIARLMNIYQVYDRNIFLDITGVGFSPYDFLRARGINPTGVHFGGKSESGAGGGGREYGNKKAEMYYRLVDSIKKGDLIINCDGLNGGDSGLPESLLSEISTCILEDRRYSEIRIIEKEQLRKVIGHSPDRLESLVLTYTRPDFTLYTDYDNYTEQEKRAIENRINMATITNSFGHIVGGQDFNIVRPDERFTH